ARARSTLTCDSLSRPDALPIYLVFVFSPPCPHCWDATENVKSYKEIGLVDEIYGVVVQGAQGTPMYVERFKPNFEIKEIPQADRSEEHTSELQSRENLVCRLLL